MKKLLLSTALVAATSAPGFAQNAAEDMFRQQANPQELRASDFIGMRVYRADEADAEAYEGVQESWDDIGEINDVIISRDGSVEAVLVDIGGFLGIGENQVAVDMESIQFVGDSATAERETDFFLILNAPRDALEEAPVYGSGAAMSDSEQTASASDGAAATAEEQTAATDDSADMTEEERAAADAGDAATADDTEDMAAATDATAETGTLTTTGSDENLTGDAATDVTPTREGYVTAADEQLTAETLMGAAAYDVNDERIGEVSQLLLAEDGKIQSAIVDVGGFLGIGAKPVELEMSKLDIVTSEDGTDLRVYVSMTEDELESMPEYEN